MMHLIGNATLSETALSSRAIVLILAAQAVFIATFVISGESLWIDEFGTVRIADVIRLSNWWEQFRHWGDSDIQMPLYHLYMFGWGQLFGLFSEYVLRLSNLPLFLIAEAALLWTFRQSRVFALTLALFSVAHPMVWYYLNEARPYTMMFLGAVLTFSAMVALAAEVGGESQIAKYSPWCFVVGIVILSGSNMLGVFWSALGIALVVALHLRGPNAALVRARWPYAALAGMLTPLLGFFAYTLLQGARGTALYRSDIGTLLFSVYELLGLTGLGPGRLDLRSNGLAAVQGWLLPLCLGVAVLVLGLLHGLYRAHKTLGSARLGLALGVAVLPAVAITAAGFVLQWRVVGRHLMPLVPVVLALYALATAALIHSSRPRHLALSLLLVGTLVFSGVSMSSARHAKDDYRFAAQVIKQALEEGQTVWWAGYREGARHYGIPLQGTARRDDGCPALGLRGQIGAVSVTNLRARCLAELPVPQLIVLSKPDAFDTRGAVVEWIRNEDFELVQEWPAFAAWQHPPPRKEPIDR